MLIQHGAANVTAIEANTQAYLRCLIIKDLFSLSSLSLLCGDFVEYLRQSKNPWDLCVASGVLYHMINPVELIDLIANVSNRIYIWTHYYDENLLKKNPNLTAKFSDGIDCNYKGFSHRLYRQNYLAALERQDFCGGNLPYSMWMDRNDLLRCLQHFGFTRVVTAFEQPDHMHGPSLALVAQK